MQDVITIGSATQDIYVFSKQFHIHKDPRFKTGQVQFFAFGTKIELDDILFEVGGGATNAAYTFKQQGLKVSCLGRVGNDGTGMEVKNCLRKIGIGDLLIKDKNHRTGRSVIFLGHSGERTILVYRGAAHGYSPNDLKKAKLKNTKWLYITSCNGNFSILKKAVIIAKESGVQIFMNPGRKEIRKNKSALIQLIKDVDILLLNREEASELSRQPIKNMKKILKKMSSITQNLVLVTDGAGGSYYTLNNKFFRVNIKPKKAVDTTGAGDAFGSGFLAGYIKYRKNINKSIVLAVNNAESVTQEIGAKHGLLSSRDKYKNAPVSISKFNI